MRGSVGVILVAALAASVHGVALPTAAQRAWMTLEMGAITHFNMVCGYMRVSNSDTLSSSTWLCFGLPFLNLVFIFSSFDRKRLHRAPTAPEALSSRPRPHSTQIVSIQTSSRSLSSDRNSIR